uniref:Uncharacterized protein n=1 Tax=Anopheles atroparvus TaxID=41427 RepID=A0A182JLM6_ANOAO
MAALGEKRPRSSRRQTSLIRGEKRLNLSHSGGGDIRRPGRQRPAPRETAVCTRWRMDRKQPKRASRRRSRSPETKGGRENIRLKVDMVGTNGTTQEKRPKNGAAWWLETKWVAMLCCATTRYTPTLLHVFVSMGGDGGGLGAFDALVCV